VKKENPNREMAQRLARKIADMSDSERAEFAARCPVILTIDGRPISGRNGMLAMMQCQNVTVIGGFRQWLAAGRAVRQGEKALYIFVPSSRRVDAAASPGADSPDGTDAGAAESVRFLMAAVFDVSQTDAVAETVAAA
jgi:hypothetical protein